LAERLIHATDTARLETVRTKAERHPTRIFANALVVLPYGLAEILMITPTGWTLTECSREVRLRA